MTTDPGEARASLYAVNAILERIDPLIREIPGVVAGEDEEYLHRMRTSSRKLRMALRLLGDRAGISGEGAFFKLIRRVTRSLGAARDLDVQILWLRTFASRCEPEALGGVMRLKLRASQARARLQPDVARMAACVTDAPAFKRTVECLRNERLNAELSGQAETYDMDRTRATRMLLLQLDSVAQHGTSLYIPEAVEAHHRLRIEIKHLRYAMEIFRELYGESLDEYIAVAKKLQGMLGDLHDADVWLEAIPGMAEAESRRTEKYFGTAQPYAALSAGYAAVQADRTAYRAETYAKTLECWKKMQDEGRWTALRQFLLKSGQGPWGAAPNPAGDLSPDPFQVESHQFIK